MSDNNIISSDPTTKIQTIFHPSDDGNKFVLEEQQDAEEIVEVNRYQYNLYDQRAPFPGDGFHKVASIPLVVLMDLEAKGITRDPKEFAKWLNDPDNRYFRTRPGRI